MAVDFTPVRLQNKAGDEFPVVTTAKDYNNLVFNGGYRKAEDQDGLEAALEGGLDNGAPIGRADQPDATETEPASVAAEDGDKQVESDPKARKVRGGQTAVATADDASA